MQLAEPMTMVTDYVLTLLGGWLGARLWCRAELPGPRRTWALAFWAMALAAALGGTSHGFAPMLSAAAQGVLWRSTMVAVGAAAVLLLYASIRAAGGTSAWAWLLGAELVAYSIWVVFVDSDFSYAVLQYGTALVVVLVIHVALAVGRRPGAWAVVSGVVISFVAAWIQQAGVSPHPSFNHNDLYHLVQMVGLIALYRGAAGQNLLSDRA